MNGLGSHMSEVEPTKLVAFVKVWRVLKSRLLNIINIGADTILRQLHLHRVHHLRQVFDSVPVRSNPWASRSLVLPMASARTDGRGYGVVLGHLCAIDHTLYSFGQVLESNASRWMPRHHALLLWHADPQHSDGLAHHRLSDL